MELIALIALFFLVMRMLVPTDTKPLIKCNIHKWVYKDAGDGNEYLICSVCNRRPGEAMDDGSEI